MDFIPNARKLDGRVPKYNKKLVKFMKKYKITQEHKYTHTHTHTEIHRHTQEIRVREKGRETRLTEQLKQQQQQQN